jgi:hypothetical protein
MVKHTPQDFAHADRSRTMQASFRFTHMQAELLNRLQKKKCCVKQYFSRWKTLPVLNSLQKVTSEKLFDVTNGWVHIDNPIDFLGGISSQEPI